MLLRNRSETLRHPVAARALLIGAMLLAGSACSDSPAADEGDGGGDVRFDFEDRSRDRAVDSEGPDAITDVAADTPAGDAPLDPDGRDLVGDGAGDAQADASPGDAALSDASDAAAGDAASGDVDEGGDGALPDSADAGSDTGPGGSVGRVLEGTALGAQVEVFAGAFVMGCLDHRDDTGGGCNPDELPAHRVRLSRDLFVMRSEVTQEMWREVFGNNPSFFPGCGDSCPVERVNWWEALAFANAVSEAEELDPCYELVTCVREPGLDLDCEDVTVTAESGNPLDCEGYRLPTEAEWELLARGGESHPYAGGDDVDQVAWYYENASTLTHAVCGKEPNGFGLCDMSGNVWEWTWSIYGAYNGGVQDDPLGADAGLERVFRGGHWYLDATWSRVARRFSDYPGFQAFGLGFRLVRTIH